MSAALRLALFAVALAALLGAGALAGATIGPDRGEDEPEPMAHADDTAGAGHAADDPAHRAGRDDAASTDAVRGLSVSADGLRLALDTPELPRSRAARLAFRVVDDRGQVVRDVDVEHAKRMHVIVVRRDMTGFQHLHPRQRRDGAWTVPVRLDDAGSYRLFADFARDGRATTLAADLRVDGPADLRPLPAPTPVATADGYRVELDAGAPRAGEEAELRFTVTRDGQPVHVQPYLGADGHLVALREGDLAYLHVHPEGHDDGHGETPADESEAAHDDAIAFAATFPTVGRYRLFLQFRHDGRVHTVAFTQEVRR